MFVAPGLEAELRRAVPISIVAVDTLFDYCIDRSDWTRIEQIVHDVERLWPDNFETVLGETVPEDPFQTLIIDQLSEIDLEGWPVPPDVKHNLETLRCLQELYDAVAATEHAAKILLMEWPVLYDPLERVVRDLTKNFPILLEWAREIQKAADEDCEMIRYHTEFILGWPDALVEQNLIAQRMQEEIDYKILMEPRLKKPLQVNDTGSFWRDAKYKIISRNSDNIALFVRYIQLQIRWNAWTERVQVKGFRDALGKPASTTDFYYSEWTDLDDNVLGKIIARAATTAVDFHPPVDFLLATLIDLAHKNTVDPVLDYLSEAETAWDRAPRLATFLHQACGTPNDPYHSAVGAYVIKSIVYRARRPGCRAHSMLLLIGEQGLNKSPFAQALAIRPEWFDDCTKLADESKELVLSLPGILVNEIAELGGSRRDRDLVKAMISRTHDRGRPAYGRCVVDRARRNTFIATSNDEKPLQDETGGKRFLPVHIKRSVDLQWVRENLEQLIGEATYMESHNVPLDLPRDILPEAREHQGAARAEQRWELILEAAVGTESECFITAADLAKFLEGATRNPPSPQQAGQKMRALKFDSITVSINNQKLKIWQRGATRATQLKFSMGQDGTVRLIGLPEIIEPPRPSNRVTEGY